MGDYGVPDEVDGALAWSWAQERLVGNKNYWVVTVSAVGRPAAMPVWGVWLLDDTFWFSCSPTARKVRNLAANPQCAVMIDDTVECVSVEGVARRVEPDDEAVEVAAASWVAKYWDDPSQHEESAAFFRRNAIFQVTPTTAYGIIEREDEFGPSATRWAF